MSDVIQYVTCIYCDWSGDENDLLQGDYNGPLDQYERCPNCGRGDHLLDKDQ